VSLLEVRNLEVDVNGKRILKGLTLTLEPGSVHAIMGPNGSGKSTLANVLAGKPGYDIISGEVIFDGNVVNDTEPEALAQAGLFLAFQYPVEIPGVSNMEFLKASLDSLHAARGDAQPNAVEFMKTVRSIASELDLNPEFLKRGVNEGFSGGEKKRNEIFQMALLEPRLAILDETDSGLDIDALRIVADGVNALRSPERAMLLVTHYQRLLGYIEPDFLHVLAGGRIVRSRDKSLALELEEKGYSWLEEAAA